MKDWTRVWLLAGLALAMAATPRAQDPPAAQVPDEVRERVARQGHVRVLVELREAPVVATPNLSRGARLERTTAVGDRVLARLSRPSGVKRFGDLPVMALSVDQEGLAQLAASPDVRSIQLDVLRKPQLAQSVPLIGAPTAWTAGATGTGWAIAVVDSGVDKTHSFLSGKVVSEACYSTTNAADSTSSLCPAGAASSTAAGSGVNCSTSISGCDHGTHVAGIAAGKGASFSGVAKDSSLIAIQVYSKVESSTFCDPDPSPCIGAYDSDVIQGLQRVYALRSTYNVGATLLPLGSGSYSGSCDATLASYKSAIDQLRSANIPTVVSSGNEGSTGAMQGPACVSTAISVGATDDSDNFETYTNRTDALSLLAPGSNITSSTPGGAFEEFGGTSMAAAHVAGAWALIRQRNPALSVTDVLNTLRSTGEPITDPVNGGSVPRLDVGQAIDALTLTFDRILTELPDFDGTNTADILWKKITAPGSYAFWLMNGASTIKTAVFSAATDWQMFDFGDMDGNGKSDILWKSQSTGALVIWFINGTSVTGFGSFGSPAGWQIRSVEDINGDGKDDLIWEQSTATTTRAAVWFMNGGTMASSAVFSVGSEWTLAGAADLNGDGRGDLIWRSKNSGALSLWFMNGATMVSSTVIPVGAGWDLVAAADGNGDGKADFYWRNPSNGALAFWFMNGGTVQSTAVVGIGTGWDLVAVGDLNGDNRADIFWRQPSTNALAYWFMNGATKTSSVAFGVGPDWQPLVPE